jgi:DNA-binding transcriptional regulator LsrR (DeoR family)
MARKPDKATQREIPKPDEATKRGAHSDEQSKEGNQAEAGDKTQNEEVIAEMDHMERISAVCDLFTKGKTVKEIMEEIKECYPGFGTLKRETPYKYVREAGTRGFLRYVPPPHHVFAKRITDRFYRLKRLNIVHTAASFDVARETANMLLRLVQQCHKSDPKKNEVHIGFAAGLSMRQVAQVFAELLAYPAPDLPKKIVFHAMLSGHDPGNPTTDPNNFFTFFLQPPVLHIKTEFVGFRAPTIVRTSAIPIFMEIEEITDAFDAVGQLDIIVTSGSDWNDPDSSLRRCMRRSASTLQTLQEEGTVGDMLWRPLGKTAPVMTATELRALTLVELGDLTEFIDRGKHVLLMLGPCAACNRHKGPIFKTILSQEQQLVTHAVADSRTAAYLIKAMDEGRI